MLNYDGQATVDRYRLNVVRNLVENPFFSVCIPQFNRTSFLLESCKSLARQTYRNFEVCVSDDCSTDGRQNEVIAALQDSGLSFVYRRRETNGRYDANLRSSIALSRGNYCFLLGNDDCLASPDVLQDISDDIGKLGPAGVILTNYAGYPTGARFSRVTRTVAVGAGPDVAADNYRNFSFVSGVLLSGQEARKYATSKWDGSEMYQVYLACRIIAAGGTLLVIDRISVLKDIEIQGETVDNYGRQTKLQPCPIVERQLPLVVLAQVVADAISVDGPTRMLEDALERVVRQLYLFTCPFWIFEYRQIQSRRYALGICLGMRPRNVMRGIPLGWWARLRLVILYVAVSCGGLLTPIKLFRALQPRLYALAKRART